MSLGSSAATVNAHSCRGMYCKLCRGPLQEKKLLVFEGTVGRDAEALGRLTEDDLRFLFA